MDVTRTLRITNGRGVVVSTVSDVLSGAAVSPSGVEQRLALPMASLSPGQYLVSVELTGRDEPTLERQLSFTIR